MNQSIFDMVLWSMVIGIIMIKFYWVVAVELRYFKKRLSLQMLRTNFTESIILFLQIYVVYFFPLPETKFDAIIMFFGIVMYTTGVIFAFWGRLSMSNVWGVPGEHYKHQNKLITHGAFAYSRNPIYVGFLLIYYGFCIAIKSWLIILYLPLLLYFYKSIKKEEKLLKENFGEQYLKYKSSVPRFIFF